MKNNNIDLIFHLDQLFVFFCQEFGAKDVAKLLVDRLRPDGPVEIIYFIGRTDCLDAYYDIANTVNYNLLDKNCKLELLDSIENLRNRDGISYLHAIKKNEKDTEVIAAIERAKKFLMEFK